MANPRVYILEIPKQPNVAFRISYVPNKNEPELRPATAEETKAYWEHEERHPLRRPESKEAKPI
jgi:hypothetical protein